MSLSQSIRRVAAFVIAPAISLGLALSSAAAQPAAIQFHADWCGKCKQLAPTLDAAAPLFAEEDIVLTVLDFTNRSAENLAIQKDVAMGVGAAAIFEQEAPRTGFVVLYDTQTGESLGKITSTMTLTDIEMMVAGLDNASE